MLTSHMEANPISVLEAMASEKPVVAPRVGSLGETVLDGKTGCLTTPGSEEEVARSVLGLLSDTDRAARFGRAGREEVVARWSIGRTVEGYERLIEDLYNSKVVGRDSQVASAGVVRPTRQMPK